MQCITNPLVPYRKNQCLNTVNDITLYDLFAGITKTTMHEVCAEPSFGAAMETAMDIYTPFTGERTKVVFKKYSTRAEIASKLSDDDVKTDPISQHMFYGPSNWNHWNQSGQ
jgi:hypothetical protein